MSKVFQSKYLVVIVFVLSIVATYAWAQNRVVVVPIGGDDMPRSAVMPSGAVVAFNLESCPPGWSQAEIARGRVVVGLQNGGTLGGIPNFTQAFSDRENRSHNHSWSIFFTESNNWNSFIDSGGTVQFIQWENGIGNEGSGFFPLALQAPVFGEAKTYFTSRRDGILPYVQFLYCEKS